MLNYGIIAVPLSLLQTFWCVAGGLRFCGFCALAFLRLWGCELCFVLMRQSLDVPQLPDSL
jgi:hypothetical protein